MSRRSKLSEFWVVHAILELLKMRLQFAGEFASWVEGRLCDEQMELQHAWDESLREAAEPVRDQLEGLFVDEAKLWHTDHPSTLREGLLLRVYGEVEGTMSAVAREVHRAKSLPNPKGWSRDTGLRLYFKYLVQEAGFEESSMTPFQCDFLGLGAVRNAIAHSRSHVADPEKKQVRRLKHLEIGLEESGRVTLTRNTIGLVAGLGTELAETVGEELSQKGA